MTSAFRRATIWPGQIAVGGIGVVLFAALVTFTFYFTATLFLIFTGMLMAVALNAMTNRLGRLIRLPHALRLAMVCVALAAQFSGEVFVGGTCCFSALPSRHSPPCTAADCCSSHPPGSAPAPPSSSTASATRWSVG
jgi:hypothetical protein